MRSLKLPQLTKFQILMSYLKWGMEDLFLAFQIDEAYKRHGPFHNAMGLELICKGYLLAEAYQESNLPYEANIKLLDRKARTFGHDIRKLLGTLQKLKPSGKIADILEFEYDGYVGTDLVTTLQSAYLECRYPFPPSPDYLRHRHPRFKKLYTEPIWSSGLEKLSREITKEITQYIFEDFKFVVDRREIYKMVGESDASNRYCNLLFES